MIVDKIRAVFARLLKLSVISVAMLGLAAPAAWAQEEDQGESAPAPQQSTREIEEVVVTGSRVKRDTYSSISPLQVISGQVSREIGLIDPSTILQESTAATGVQIDLTFSGFRLDNGPAASTVDLRGLGDSRTLILVNGRRLAPAGVEGAPYAVDTNLIPGTLVQQYDVLLDGASSVYGSDAVAGVVNVILRKDFDGLELQGYSNIPAGGDGDGLTNRLNVTWGKNFDRGFIGFGAEYRDQQPVSLRDREWFAECEKHREITTEGEIRTEDLFYSTIYNQKSPGDCQIGAIAGFVNEYGPPRIGSLFNTPGFTNIGVPGLSHWNSFGTPIDTTGSGVADVSFVDYAFNGNDRAANLTPELQTTSLFAYGEYTFEGDGNVTPYFEVQYNRRESAYYGGPSQANGYTPADNPFNPCNPNQPNGSDCGLGWDSLLDNPDFAADFAVVNGLTPAELRDFGIVDLYTGAVGAFDMWTFFSVDGDRTDSITDLSQERIVAGVKGDLPSINFGSVQNWSYDVYASYTESDGDSSRNGIREDLMDFALGNYSFTSTPCSNDIPLPASDTATGCVPVNVFAPSLYANATNNDFATQAERDYVFDSRDFRTKYMQSVFSAYATGELFDLPGGPAQMVIGVEQRDDEIESLPDQVAADGLFVAFFVDQGAVGEKWTKEAFLEFELPLVAGRKGMQELTTNLSTRYTKDEFYGSAWTYSAKLAYRPVDSLLIRATTGTSFRAPNLRENFLAGQTGFLQVLDPCVVPLAAIDINGNYDPALDNRQAVVISNCAAEGVIDPTTFTNGGNAIYFVEAREGGATDLDEETSKSMSAGITWEQPFWDSFDLALGVTYYDIKISDEIIEPGSGFIIADCYTDNEGDSPFCSRITRDATGAIGIVDEGFINRDQINARGVDVNMTINYPTQLFGKAVDWTADFTFNHNIELSSKLLAGEEEELDEFQGEVGFPKWQGRALLRADVGNFRYTWATRYVSSVQQEITPGLNEFSSIFDFSDTCLGAANGDVDCRDVDQFENYFTHDMSVYYLGEQWTIGAGMRNAFNKKPPSMDPFQSGFGTNAAFGSGYDVFGRTAFVDLVYKWQ